MKTDQLIKVDSYSWAQKCTAKRNKSKSCKGVNMQRLFKQSF